MHQFSPHQQAQTSPLHSQRLQQPVQLHQQQQVRMPSFIPPTSVIQSHTHYQSRQPQLQLEHHYDDLIGLDGLRAHSYAPQQHQHQHQQQAPVVIGVGQGPGNASPKYTARTATALAANAYSSDAYVFSHQQQQGDRSPPNSGNGSPSAIAGGQGQFNTRFSFVATNSVSSGAGMTISEGVSPHEPLQQHHSQQQQQDYLDAHGYNSLNKRRRADAVPEGFPGEGSGEEDVEYGRQHGYGQFNEGYSPDVMGHGGMVVSASGQPPELLQGMQQGLGDLGQGVGFSISAGANQDLPFGSDTRPKQVHRQACGRCKNLKVRCEFTTDPNTCRRCLNGGHECAIPGRKKRRQPPKREHLLNEIREQADQIRMLAQKLEEYQKRALHNEPVRLSLSNTPLPPPGSKSVAGPSFAAGSIVAVPRPDVQEWIEKARESIQAIGGLIDNGAFAEEGEGYEESEEELEGDDADYAQDTSADAKWREPARLHDTDSEADTDAPSEHVRSPDSQEFGDMQMSRYASPASTVRSTELEGSAQPSRNRGHSHGRGSRRKTSQPPHLAPLPTTPAAPFGLIAQLSLATEIHRQGSRSPKNFSSAIPVNSSNSGAPTTQAEADVSPLSAGSNSAEGLHQIDNDESNSLAEVQVTVKREESASEGEGYGAAAPGFFEARRGSVPDPSRLAPARHPVPHILMRGIVSPKEVEILFNIYFDKMNLSCSLLDPVLYTAQTTYWRSPFLFTVICAIASRYYTEHAGLYEELTTYAQLAAGTALISGPKNVESVSAYILLSLYPVPMRRWEEDRTWLYLGLAIRVATDLNLHHPNTARPRNETHARELLNRTRVWLNCYNLDRSTSSWHGKANTIASGDYTACHSEAWYEYSLYNMPNFDIQLAAYNAELRQLGEFKQKIYSNSNNPTGLNKDLDLNNLSSEIDEKLVALEAEWNRRLREKTDPNDPQGRFRNSLIKLAYRYARLTVLSFGFQHAFGKSHSEQALFFDRCYRAATDVLRVFIDELSSQRVYLRHGPDAQSVFVTFASAFLIKLLHPKYVAYLKMEQRKEIETLVRGIIDLLSSPEVVVDDKHSPKLWARFLDGLLATPMAKVELSPNVLKGGNALPRRSTRRLTQRPHGANEKRSENSQVSPSQGAISSAMHSPNSSFTNVDSLNSSPLNINRTLSSSLSAPLVTASEGNYSTTYEEASATVFDGGLGQQGSFQVDANPMMSQQQEQPGMDMYSMPNALQMNVPELFRPPLPFDNDLLQSIGSMPDTSLWQDMPGFNWMNILQSSDADSTMQDTIAPNMMNFNIDNSQMSGNLY
ncbi:hypothetical protein EW145_g3361 [Phellinidium pouzarii]|uniref:Zn(2)-C6 fungal-type domain-containing protein n=1 Tax=Phellinidium pouzarii TaxID=167371 RepID=A0A4S4L7S3_9AGAM|nr:hypothetical protein EW145_g3361 [Phellinidium pouzarii]